jgi:hypothetical protein
MPRRAVEWAPYFDFGISLQAARVLECGDLSPLSSIAGCWHGESVREAKGWNEIQSGDKSPHSKEWPRLGGVFLCTTGGKVIA